MPSVTSRLALACWLAALLVAPGCSCGVPEVEVPDEVDGGGGDDAGQSCVQGETRACGVEVGACVAGEQTCGAGGTWSACAGEVGPVAEACNGADDDCDGEVDEGCHCAEGATQACGSDVGECRRGTQSCLEGEWGACAGEVVPGAEACNGLDDDCDGEVDEGCGCIDGATVACGSDVGSCQQGVRTCALGAWGACVGEIAPAAEACNGVDDDCDDSIDEGCGCTDGATQPCGSDVGACQRGVQTCAGGSWGACAGEVGPVAESCNDLDDDCDGALDEGCDDDLDGHCDATMSVVGTPAICPGSPPDTGDDCDDGRAAVKPSAVEVCGDGLDNDCDGLTDTAEPAACPAIGVKLNVYTDPLPVSHGKSTALHAALTPSDPALAWSRTWAVIDAAPAATCAVADVVLSGQSDDAAFSRISALMPDLPAKVGCVYTVEVTVNGYARDRARLEVVNRAPTVWVDYATFDGSAWRLFAVAGSTLQVTASALDPDGDKPLLFDWSGADEPRLGCAPNCASSSTTATHKATVSFATAAAPGTYHLTAEVSDGFSPPVTAPIILEVDTCVWVREGGTGTGATPGSPLGSVQAALELARNAAGSSVCVQGSGVFTEDLVLPAAPHTPGLYGGFTAAGAVDIAQLPVVEVSTAQGVTFAAGHQGQVKNLSFRQAAGAPLGAIPAAIVTVKDASPLLMQVTVKLGVGSPPLGVDVVDSAAVAAAARPTLSGSTVSSTSGTGADAIGIRVARTTATPEVALVGTSISLATVACPTFCRGLYVERARATVADARMISVSATTGSAVAIDVAGAPGSPATATIRRSSASASTQDGPQTVAVRLFETDGVIIQDNAAIGSLWASAGREFSAGIADGRVTRAGIVTRGNSTGLTIKGNDMIAGGASPWAGDCSSAGTGEGADVVAGVFLAGTSASTLSGNGRAGHAGSAIFGGDTTIHWNPATRRLLPSSVGLWLVETAGVQVLGNELRSGTYRARAGCAVPTENPASIAFRDGLPPNPAFSGGVPGEKPSTATVLDGNGISCARPPQGTGPVSGPTVWCVAAELNAPAAGAPVLTNNSIAATKGNYCIALRQRGGSGVVAANNTFDADLVLEPWDPQPAPGTVIKWPLFLENLGPAGIHLTNNILYAHRDDPADQAGGRLVIREVVASGTLSRIGTLKNNLFYIQGDDVTVPGAPYLRVTDGTSSRDYSSAGLNAISGVAASTGNFASPPGLTEPASDWKKSTARLEASSAAIDRGLSPGGGVPSVDIDGDVRPRGAGVDVGHDER